MNLDQFEYKLVVNCINDNVYNINKVAQQKNVSNFSFQKFPEYKWIDYNSQDFMYLLNNL